MHKNSSKVLVIAGFVFFFAVVAATLAAVYLGKAYKQSLGIVPEVEISNQKIVTQKVIKKITIQDLGNAECLEITPDGAVRAYDTCGGQLTRAGRMTSLRDISTLIRLVSENNLSTLSHKQDGSGIEIIIESDQGIEYLYLPTESQTSGDLVSLILATITQIKGDVPPVIFTETPKVSPSIVIMTSTPTPTSLPSGVPTPTPTIAQGGSTGTDSFTCDFTESNGKKKPVTISNIVCSTDPVVP